MLTRAEKQAAERARKLLCETDLFAELGLPTLSSDARMCARAVLELTAELNAERSARVQIQAGRDRLQEIVGTGVYYLALAECAHDAARSVLAKREHSRLHAVDPKPEIEFGEPR